MNNPINYIELSAILYYADFLSMKEKSIPVSDNCKYFFVYNAPINSSYIAGVKPMFDEDNEYFKQSFTEYMHLRRSFGEDGIMSFVNSICNLSSCGKVSGEDMLRCLHRYSQKSERINALNKYKQHVKSTKYTHLIKQEDGKQSRVECTKYIAHEELVKNNTTEPEIHVGSEEIPNIQEVNPKIEEII